MTHCNFYHSEKLGIVLMGDAAHATSPSIGMGMNHALGDAAALDELLAAHGGKDLATVLPAYSALRVKEGNALTDIADLIQSYDGAHNLRNTLRQAARGVGHALLPSLVAPEPYMAIGNGMKLSEAYAELVRVGRLPAVRKANAAVKQRHFEIQTGMVPPPPARAGGRRLALVFVLVAIGTLMAGGWLWYLKHALEASATTLAVPAVECAPRPFWLWAKGPRCAPA